MPPSSEWRVDVDGVETSAVLDAAVAGPGPRTVLLCAHGAGGNLADRGILALTGILRARGIHIVRFNFLYREKGTHRPDPMPRLKECYAAVVRRARLEIESDRFVIGGRSMGGRVASMLAAEGFPCDGLLLLAYPLHPPGRFEQRRDAHLPSIQVPVICFNGTRDDFCRRDLMEAALSQVTAPWEMHWLEGADHGFHVLKSSGRTDSDVLTEIAEATNVWISRLGDSR
jgi:hypothetical protein